MSGKPVTFVDRGAPPVVEVESGGVPVTEVYSGGQPYVLVSSGGQPITVTNGIRSLFLNGEPGVWYDPSDLSTLYRDHTGLTPVTAAGQSVGLVLDKSGNDNHATQATAAARPIYGVVPATGARNLHPYSQSDTGFSPFGATPPVVTNGATHLGQSCVALTFDATMTPGFSNCRAERAVNVAITNGVTYTGSHHLSLSRALTGGEAITVYFTGSSGLGRVDLTAANSDALVGSFVRMTGFVSPASATGIVSLRPFLLGAVSSPVTLYLNRSQLEASSAATAYQATQTLYDITEEGVRSLGYLSFDGVDDWLGTPTITPGTDKAQVFAGVRKLSDAAQGLVAELGDIVTDNGSVSMSAPSAPGNFLGARSKGTTLVSIQASGFAAPISSVLTASGDISGDLVALRVNGTQAVQSTADQGTGNYLDHPMYIGMRAGTSVPFNGRIYGLAVRFGSNLTDDQISRVERYMANKAGVTL